MGVTNDIDLSFIESYQFPFFPPSSTEFSSFATMK